MPLCEHYLSFRANTLLPRPGLCCPHKPGRGAYWGLFLKSGSFNVTEGDIGGLHFPNVTERPAGKKPYISRKNKADLRLHKGVDVTEGQP